MKNKEINQDIMYHSIIFLRGYHFHFINWSTYFNPFTYKPNTLSRWVTLDWLLVQYNNEIGSNWGTLLSYKRIFHNEISKK